MGCDKGGECCGQCTVVPVWAPKPGDTVLLLLTKQVGVVSDEMTGNSNYIRIRHIGAVPIDELRLIEEA